MDIPVPNFNNQENKSIIDSLIENGLNLDDIVTYFLLEDDYEVIKHIDLEKYFDLLVSKCSYNMLIYIAYNCSLSKHIDYLLNLNDFHLNSCIAQNTNINKEHIGILINQNDAEINSQLLKLSYIKSNITEEQINILLNRNNKSYIIYDNDLDIKYKVKIIQNRIKKEVFK